MFLRNTLFAFALTSSLLFFGCASEKRVDDIAVSPQAGDNPSQEIAALEREVADAREKNIPTLSPGWFAGAEKSLNQAKKLRDEGGNFKDIFKATAEGRAQLQRARDFAGSSDKQLADVIEARKEAWGAYRAAEASGATKLNELADSYNTAEEKFKSLTKAVEDNDTGRISGGRQDAIKAYRAAQAEAMVKEKLDPAKRIVGQAEKEDAGHYAPKSLAAAKEFISASEKFIQNSPGSTKEVDAKADDAMFYAKRSLELTRASHLLADKKPEERILWVEENVTGLANALGADDDRDQTLDQQFTGLKTLAQQLRQQQEGAGTNSKQLASETQQLKSEVQSLSTQLEKNKAQKQAMDQAASRVKKTAALFGSKDAEVSQKDQNVVLRLKGIKFPSGKSSLGSENFPLLAKVNEALAMYPDSQIVVEGHTDSVGGQQNNMKLSQERADSVRDYLVSTKQISEDRVTAKGWGFSKPLASNKTAQGRASNRRIDIVIVGAAAPSQLAE